MTAELRSTSAVPREYLTGNGLDYMVSLHMVHVQVHTGASFSCWATVEIARPCGIYPHKTSLCPQRNLPMHEGSQGQTLIKNGNPYLDLSCPYLMLDSKDLCS